MSLAPEISFCFDMSRFPKGAAGSCNQDQLLTLCLPGQFGGVSHMPPSAMGSNGNGNGRPPQHLNAAQMHTMSGHPHQAGFQHATGPGPRLAPITPNHAERSQVLSQTSICVIMTSQLPLHQQQQISMANAAAPAMQSICSTKT